MTKVWTEHLAESEVKLMNEIIEQIPTDHGAREAFVNIVQKLADSASAEFKLKYILAGDGDVYGTNDDGVARMYAENEEYYVIDVANNKWLCCADPEDDTDILEHME